MFHKIMIDLGDVDSSGVNCTVEDEKVLGKIMFKIQMGKDIT